MRCGYATCGISIADTIIVAITETIPQRVPQHLNTLSGALMSIEIDAGVDSPLADLR
jgi:hypothetical protein